MAQQEIGHAGETPARQLTAGVDIVHHPAPAALGAEVQSWSALRHGLAVAQVVVAHHGKAVRGQILRKRLIPQDVLRHAVGNLQDRPDLTLGDPLHRVNIGMSVGGGEGKFVSDHGKPCLLMLY